MIDELITDVEHLVLSYLEEHGTLTAADALGLDRRAGYALYVGEEFIACRTDSRGSLEYYGGFEYVDKSCVTTLGSYTFYLSGDCSRVEECIDRFFETERE